MKRIFAVLAVLVLFCPAWAAAIDFENPDLYSAGDSCKALCVDDFNQDGHNDIAVTNSGSSDFTVFLYSGDFSNSATYDVSGYNNKSYTICSADIYRDLGSNGYPDLIIASWNAGQVRLFRNLGDGTFDDSYPLPYKVVGHKPTAVVSGDFDGDGDKDIAVANSGTLTNGHTVCVLENTGNGLSDPVYYTVYYPYDLCTGDFDADGDLDIAVGKRSWSAGIGILLNDGSGNFSLGSGASGPYHDRVSICSGDFDEDGYPDIAAVFDYRYAYVYMNNGDGSIADYTTYSLTNQTSLDPRSICSGDFSDDGALDIAVASSGHPVSIICGMADGTFTDPVYFGTNGYGNNDICGAFLDIDDMIDIVVANYQSSNISVLINDTQHGGSKKIPVVYARNSSSGGLFGTRICFSVPDPCMVSIDIYDVTGRRVANVFNKRVPAGEHQATWNGKNAAGAAVASGVYFARMNAGPSVATAKVMLIH